MFSKREKLGISLMIGAIPITIMSMIYTKGFIIAGFVFGLGANMFNDLLGGDDE